MSSTDLPIGTVTFLYTDIEGSASLWERFPEAMRAAQSEHDAVLRETVAAHGGRVYKVIGDSFQAAFPVAVSAVKAAVAIQRRLASAQWGETGPLRVRMGVHAGEAIPLEVDYDTTHTLNRVARIMSAGHGGQILISQTVAELARGALPEGVTLRDLGQHRMKGLSQLERLSQVCAPGLPQDFPALKTQDKYPNNLPAQVTTFIGRESEIGEVIQGLAFSRLMTLMGPGGAGKTRLALEVGGKVLGEYPGGVWFVDLAPLQSPSMVPQAVAGAIGLREQEGRQITDQLADYLHNKQLLLILDNCEHLVEACARFADLALRSGPQTRILFTASRSRFSEGYDLFRRARERWPAADPGEPALAGRLLVRYPEPGMDPGTVYRQGLEIALRYDDPIEVAYAKNQLGRHLAHRVIDFEGGMALLEESLIAYRQLGDDFAAGRVLDDLAFGYSLTDQDKRVQYGEHSLALRRKIGDLIGVANVLRNLAVAAYWKGDGRGAERYIEEALTIAHQMGDLNSIAWLRSLQSEGSLLKGDFEASLGQIEEAQRISQEVNDRDLIQNCLLVRAILISILDQDYTQAKQLLLEAHSLGSPPDMLTVQAYYAYALIYNGLGDFDQSAQYLVLMLEVMGQMGVIFAGFPLLIPLIALTLFRQGKPDLSAQCLGYLDHLPKELTGWMDHLHYLPQLRKDLAAKLGTQAYEDALQRGAALDIEAVAAEFTAG